MEKKNYFAPKVKFHKLMAKSTMLAGSDDNAGSKDGNNGGDDDFIDFVGDDQELGAKRGYLNFDED